MAEQADLGRRRLNLVVPSACRGLIYLAGNEFPAHRDALAVEEPTANRLRTRKFVMTTRINPPLAIAGKSLHCHPTREAPKA